MNSVEVFISCHSDLSASLSFRPSGASGEICWESAIVFADKLNNGTLLLLVLHITF